MERTAIMAGGDLVVGLLGLCERVIVGEGDDAAECGVEALEAVEIDGGEALGGELAGAIQRVSWVTGAKAMSSSFLGSGVAAVGAGTK